MKLIRAEISGYKHLHKTVVNFLDSNNEFLQTEVSIRFFIGLNGSGKSVFLEGLCFIFSRIVQDELPGFDFSLKYSIHRNSRRHIVTVENKDNQLEISVQENGHLKRLSAFKGYRELLPDYVLTCASGSNCSFFDIMVRSPKTALYSDIFDESELGRSRLDNTERKRNIDNLLISLRSLDENPMCIFVDNSRSLLVLAAFFAIIPRHNERAYLQRRGKIFQMLESNPQPISLSFTLGKNEDGKAYEIEELFDYKPVPIAWNTTDVYTFLFEGDKNIDDTHVKSLSENFGSPVEFLSKLMLMYNKGIIKDVHMNFKIKGTENIVDATALSEGEYMLLVRLGLLAIVADSNLQCLFFMDEPDVHLNEHWNIDFISTIQQIYQGLPLGINEIIIATHSSLILTDALPNQLYYFRLKENRAECHNITTSTFGANRNEIMQALFQTEHPVGSYSYRKIDDLLETIDDADELEKVLESVGSGYLRLLLLNKIQNLRG